MEIATIPAPQASVAVRGSGNAGQARRLAAAAAAAVPLNPTAAARVALIVTEMASNLLRHAVGGELIIRALKYPAPGIELLAIDRGPGMDDVSRCLADGFSTAGTSGTGLGTIQRNSDEFDILSTRGRGTVVMARIHAAASRRRTAGRVAEPGVVSLPMTGETACGDAWGFASDGGLSSFMVVDGLGHGPLAAKAAEAASAVFQANPFRPPAAQLEAAHTGLHGTRGAAMAVALLDRRQGRLRFAGVGNIAAAVLAPCERHTAMSRNGIVGFGSIRVQEEQLAWSEAARLILHSDGLISRWANTVPEGLFVSEPSLVAGALYRDFKRGHDDVTVLVAS